MKPEVFEEYPTLPDKQGRYWRAAVVVPDGAGRVWAVKPTDVDKWVLPGGHIDEGEHPEMAARREAMEEAGLTVEIIDHLGVIETASSLTHVFLARSYGAIAAPQTPWETEIAAPVPLSALAITDQAVALKGLTRQYQQAKLSEDGGYSTRTYVRHPAGSSQGGEFARTPGGGGGAKKPDETIQKRSKDAVISQDRGELGTMITEIGRAAHEETRERKALAVGMEVLGAAKAPQDSGPFDGRPKDLRLKLNKPQTGMLGDMIAEKLYKGRLLFLDTKQSNYPIDALAGDEAIEIKAGLISNVKGAQQWRVTKGEAGELKKEMEANLSREKLAKYNAGIKKYLMKRKAHAVGVLSKMLGRQLKPVTLAMVIDTDAKVVKVYKFAGHHERVGWRSKLAKENYVGEYTYSSRSMREAWVGLSLAEAIVEWDETKHPRDAGGRFATSGVGMTSPSVEEDVALDTALDRTLNGEEHARWRDLCDKFDRELKLAFETVDAVGDTSEWGSEDSFFTTYKSGTYDDIALAAVQKGLAMNQKAVLPFKLDENGPDSLYTLDVPEVRFSSPKALERLGKMLDEHGLAFRTFMPAPGGTGTRIAIVSLASAYQVADDAEKVDRLSLTLGVDAHQSRGLGEIIGADTREAAAGVFRERIKRYRPSLSEALRMPIVDVTQKLMKKGVTGFAIVGGRHAPPEPSLRESGDFDESKHPRDDKGQFASSGSSALVERALRKLPLGSMHSNGFLLPDGRVLDVGEDADHGKIGDELYPSLPRGSAKMRFNDETGAVMWSHDLDDNRAFATFSRRPSSRQIRQMVDFARANDATLTLDHYEYRDGKHLKSGEDFHEPTVETVTKWLDREKFREAEAEWDEAQHPRDEKGKFAATGAARSTIGDIEKGRNITVPDASGRSFTGEIVEVRPDGSVLLRSRAGFEHEALIGTQFSASEPNGDVVRGRLGPSVSTSAGAIGLGTVVSYRPDGGREWTGRVTGIRPTAIQMENADGESRLLTHGVDVSFDDGGMRRHGTLGAAPPPPPPREEITATNSSGQSFSIRVDDQITYETDLPREPGSGRVTDITGGVLTVERSIDGEKVEVDPDRVLGRERRPGETPERLDEVQTPNAGMVRMNDYVRVRYEEYTYVGEVINVRQHGITIDDPEGIHRDVPIENVLEHVERETEDEDDDERDEDEDDERDRDDDDDDEDEPHTPESWDELSIDQQLEAESAWKAERRDRYVREEINDYVENVLPDSVRQDLRDDVDFKSEALLGILSLDKDNLRIDLDAEGRADDVAKLAGLFDDTDEAKEALGEAINDIDVKVSWQDKLNLSDDEAAKIPFAGGPDPRQLTVEGVSHEDLVREYRINKWHEVKGAVDRLFNDNFESNVESRVSRAADSVSEDDVRDAVLDRLAQDWDNLRTSERFEAAQEAGVVEARRRGPSRASSHRDVGGDETPDASEPVTLPEHPEFAPIGRSNEDREENLINAASYFERGDNSEVVFSARGARLQKQLDRHNISLVDLVEGYTPFVPEMEPETKRDKDGNIIHKFIGVKSAETTLRIEMSSVGAMDYSEGAHGDEGEPEPTLHISGTIRDTERGRTIGSFTRSLHLDSGVVEHKTFFIEKDYQGGGVGGLFSVTTDNLYQHLGMKSVQLTAISEKENKITGNQMWPLQGYDWANDRIAGQCRTAFQKAIAGRYGEDSEEYKAVSKMVRNDGTATDFVRYVDTKGHKVGFELMHLSTLAKESGMARVSGYLVPMSRSLTGGDTSIAWKKYKDKTTDELKKTGAKKAKALKEAEGNESGAHDQSATADLSLEEIYELIDAINAAYAEVGR